MSATRVLHCSLAALFSLACFISCSRPNTPAASASFKEFNGGWKGTWSWDASASTKLEVSDGRFAAVRFPVQDFSGQTHVVSAQGEAQFEREYGAGSRPCVLLYFDDPKIVVPVFISKDKKRLLYDFDVTYDREIVFSRQ